MRVSIVISVYQSHEAVRRQVLYFEKMPLPDGIELILVDDGSEPALAPEPKSWLTVLQTGNKLAWTQGLGRNMGAAAATGDILFFTDIDHILSKAAIEAAQSMEANRMLFPRYIAVLDERGELRHDADTLAEYGFDIRRMETTRKKYASFHGNTFAIRRGTFEELGGYDYRHCTWGFHPKSRLGDDCDFNHRWNHWAQERDIQPVHGPAIFMFPVGRYNITGDNNPKGLFHNLSYDYKKRHVKGEERG